MGNNTTQQIPEGLLDAVGEELPTFTAIERYAKGGTPPKCCEGQTRDNCTAKILFALTRKVYSPQKAGRLWDAIIEHNKWLMKRLGRNCGVSVAALDYLMNVSGKWDEAVVAEVNQIETLTEAATLDGLTGLYVREVFDSWLEKSVAESQRYGDALSLLMADIDDFKKVNDTHGHQVGDRVLKTIGSDFMDNLRSSDFAARYGGEELVAGLPHTKIHSAHTVAEKVRRAVSERFYGTLGITMSVGGACWGEGMNGPNDLVEAADRALYTAKKEGKNCVVFDPPKF